MNKKVIKILGALLIIIISFSLMIIFREENISQLWNKTRIIVFDKSYELDSICEVLDRTKSEYICENSKEINLYSELVPVITDEKYFSEQKKFFSDSKSLCNIFYFPDVSSYTFKKVLNALKKAGISFSTDSKTKYPYISFIFFLSVFLIILYFTASKKLFLLTSIPLIILSFSCPFWTQALSATILLLLLYNILPDINRSAFFKEHIKSFTNIFYLLTFFIVSFFSGLKISLFTIMAFLSSLALYYLYLQFDKYYSGKKHIFEPILILKADSKKRISTEKLILTALPLLISFIALMFSLSSVSLFQNDASQIKVPCPQKSYGSFSIKNFEENTDENDILPDMSAYIQYAWNAVTLPYRSFNYSSDLKPRSDESIHFTDYIKTENGIALNDKILYTFNDEFLKSSLSFIESTYPVIEKVLLNQGHFCKVGYSVMTKAHGESFMTVKILIILFCSVTCLIYSVIVWRKNGFKQ